MTCVIVLSGVVCDHFTKCAQVALTRLGWRLRGVATYLLSRDAGNEPSNPWRPLPCG
jgi:hypothetical protein